jgi:hypothetical protein
MSDSRKREFSADSQNVCIWDEIFYSKRKSILNILKKIQKEKLRKTLNDSRKALQKDVYIWDIFEDSQMVDLLKILSINYSLANMVFAAGKVVEKYSFSRKEELKNVYISLEEGNLKDKDKKAFIDGDIIKPGTLYLTISYDIGGGITKYDNDGYILNTSARFLVGHEIGHIVLHPKHIIDGIHKGDISSKLDEIEKENEAIFLRT